jgi:hypothetical protein
MPKKLSRQVVRGQQGINLIERVVLAMHCTWTPTGATEVGIDGYIELFDPGTQHSLGKSLGVQSKVNATLSNERDDSFDYYCSERDLQYWLRGNLPVLLIVSRPENEEAYWLSIKDYFDTPEKIASKKTHFSKSVQRFDEHCLSSLVRTGRSATEGLYLGPTPQPERLISNLLTLKDYPEKLWIADTTQNRTLKDQLYPHVRHFPRADCFAFSGTPESASVRWNYRSLKRRSSMTVVAKYGKKSRDGRQFTWLRHLAFRRQFRLFESLSRRVRTEAP